MRRTSIYAQGLFYIFAGLYHFINPEFYYSLIPDYLPYPRFINVLSGTIEILLGEMLFFSFSRKTAGYAIICMLIVFIPSHIYFIELGSCIERVLCVPKWVGWGRLLVIHPLLIWWAWSITQTSPIFHRALKS